MLSVVPMGWLREIAISPLTKAKKFSVMKSRPHLMCYEFYSDWNPSTHTHKKIFHIPRHIRIPAPKKKKKSVTNQQFKKKQPLIKMTTKKTKGESKHFYSFPVSQLSRVSQQQTSFSNFRNDCSQIHGRTKWTSNPQEGRIAFYRSSTQLEDVSSWGPCRGPAGKKRHFKRFCSSFRRHARDRRPQSTQRESFFPNVWRHTRDRRWWVFF